VEFEYRYHGSSAVDSSARSTNMSFAPDTKREPTYFRGELHQSLEFREAISALNAVVVRPALQAQGQDRLQGVAGPAGAGQLAAGGAQRSRNAAQIKDLQAELDRLIQTSNARMAPFYAAKQKYFDYLYKKRPRRLVRPRPGHHRPPRRGLLRVLQPGRVDLRPPRRRLRGLSRTSASSPAARPTSTTPPTSTTSSRRSAATNRPSSRSTRPASKSRPPPRTPLKS
jgi:hypothetical protein